MWERSSDSSFRLSLAHVLAIHDHGAAIGPDQADDVLEQHALAGARGAQQGDRLALAHLEVDPVQHHLLPELPCAGRGARSLVEQQPGEDGVEHQDEHRAGDHRRRWWTGPRLRRPAGC